MAKKDQLRLTRTQQEESLEKYSGLHRDMLQEHVNWRRKHDNAIVLLKDEEYEQNRKDLLDEMERVANAIIDNEPRLKLAE